MSGADWLRRIDPPVPPGFDSWLELPPTETPIDGSSSLRPGGARRVLPAPSELVEAAISAVGRALAPEGREREGAFDLLAADAFATWAAEAALDRPEVEDRLMELRDRLAGSAGTE